MVGHGDSTRYLLLLVRIIVRKKTLVVPATDCGPVPDFLAVFGRPFCCYLHRVCAVWFSSFFLLIDPLGKSRPSKFLILLPCIEQF